MAEPKSLEYERVVRSETAFAFVGGIKEMMRLNAELAIDTLLESYGPNARGQFRIRVRFIPDHD